MRYGAVLLDTNVIFIGSPNCTDTSSQAPSSKLPLAQVVAGFPSPAGDFVEPKLDLNAYLVPHPTTTFFARVHGHSMIDAGINEGDLLIIDRSQPWREGAISVCNLNGEFTVKFLRKRHQQWMLQGANPDMPPIVLAEGDELSLWGIVTHIVHKV